MTGDTIRLIRGVAPDRGGTEARRNPARRGLSRLTMLTLSTMKGLYDRKADSLWVWCADHSDLLWYDHSHIANLFAIPYDGDDDCVIAFTLTRHRRTVVIDRNFLLDFPAFAGLGIRPSATGG